ncbi:GTP-binding protein Rheb-like [Mya arenaria]|uniref:GTP-binding protein Rheb-like n=1 Tax=Mya arenaria TaxID=6604 RepID=UPI0022E1A5F5|nr:GTP-binding protein Rheb-like [Mya arenaria]
MNNSVQDPMWDCQGEDDVELGLVQLLFSGHDVNEHGHGCKPSFQSFRNPTPITQHMNMDGFFSGPEYDFQLVGTTGQDEYTIRSQSYFMSIDCYIPVYSVNSLKSFRVIHFGYDKLLDMKGNIGHIPSILVSDMSELSMEREVSSDAGRRLTEKWKTPFMETSAKEQFTVSRLFEQLIMTMAKAVMSEKKDFVIF